MYLCFQIFEVVVTRHIGIQSSCCSTVCKTACIVRVQLQQAEYCRFALQEVFLMIIFSEMKAACGCNESDYTVLFDLLLSLFGLFGQLSLDVAVIPNRRHVLTTPCCCCAVRLPENVEQFSVTRHPTVEVNFHAFGVITEMIIRRILLSSPCISDTSPNYPFDAAKDGVRAPKSP
jgi:hypothetical protein